MLRSFSQDDRDHMIENGVITVTCEFCNSSYVFQGSEVGDQGSGASPLTPDP
jgi:molecular chaperone Hsp33